MLNSYNLALIGFGVSIVELYKNNQKTLGLYMLQNKIQWQNPLH